MFYVVKMDNPQRENDTGAPTRVRLVGPFCCANAAGEWGADVKNNPCDNPCWQVVDLLYPMVTVEKP